LKKTLKDLEAYGSYKKIYNNTMLVDSLTLFLSYPY